MLNRISSLTRNIYLKKVNDIYFRYVRAAQKMSRKFVMQIEEIIFFSVSRLAISREPPRATL